MLSVRLGRVRSASSCRPCYVRAESEELWINPNIRKQQAKVVDKLKTSEMKKNVRSHQKAQDCLWTRVVNHINDDLD